MNPATLRLLRLYAPWALAGLLVWALAGRLLPATLCRMEAIRAEIARLDRVAPNPEVLRAKLARAESDSVARAALRRLAETRQASGSDPSSSVAAMVVPRLESRGVSLQRVGAREEGREVLLSLSVRSSWSDLLAGFSSLDSLPFAWRTRRLVLRPEDGFRLSGELVLGVPVAPREAP